MQHKRELINKSIRLFKNKELIFRLFKIINFKNITNIYNFKLNMLFKEYNLKGTFRNLCITSYRSKSFFRKFQLSRFEVKKLVSERLLIGVQKAC